MANAIYPKWKQALMSGGSSSVLTATVRAYLIDANVYTYSASHTFVSDLTGIVGSASGDFQNKTFTDGVFDADNISFTGVTGNSAEAIVIFIETFSGSSFNRLVAYLDTGFTGLPITPNGNDIPVVWSPDGIFKL
jgi:hypothetical protein